MRKNKILFLLLAALSVVSCNEPLDKNLPHTDTSQFISGNTVTFPRGTKVVDVYNTVSSIYFDNEWHDVTNGEWKYINTINIDGLITQTWEAVSFSKIKHTKKDYRGYVVCAVYLYTDDSNIKEIAFDWHGEWVVVDTSSSSQPIEGDITFTF